MSPRMFHVQISLVSPEVDGGDMKECAAPNRLAQPLVRINISLRVKRCIASPLDIDEYSLIRGRWMLLGAGGELGALADVS